jgi:transposase-like protein
LIIPRIVPDRLRHRYAAPGIKDRLLGRFSILTQRALAEMYVQGVSTRKVKAVTETLCGHSFSASSISAINHSLDAGLKAFAERRLEEA